MQYSDYVNSLAAALPMQVTDATSDTPFATKEYNLALPRGIEYAELRMLRDPDLDFLAVRQTIGNLSLTQNNRSFVVPDKLIVLERFAVFTPVGTTSLNGTRNLLVPASADVIDFFYAGAATGVPQYWAPIYDSSQGALSGYKWIAVGPAP